VDELAHTNAPGSRHVKRYQDVLELLDNGIDVYTTLNVQHLESRADTVAQITGSRMRETVPDSIFDLADSIEIIDLPPDELLKRLTEGKVYIPERSQQAIENFFKQGNLTALREMALRAVAERVDHQLRELMRSQRISGPWKAGQRLLVGISPSPNTVNLIRWARRTAYTMDASWIAVYVESSRTLTDPARDQLRKNMQLARELGAEIITTADEDIVSAILRVAREQNATQLLVGKPARLFPFTRSLAERLIEESRDLDVYVVGGRAESAGERRFFSIPEIQSGLLQYIAAFVVVGLVAVFCYPFADRLGYQTVSLILLLTVALLPLKLGVGPVLFGASLSALVWNFFFIPPHFTFAIGLPQDLLMFAMYFCIAAVAGVLTARVRAREKAVRSRESRSSALYRLTRDLSVARSLDEVVKAAVSNIRKQFDAEVAVFLSQRDGDIFTAPHPESTFTIDEKEFGVASWVYWNEKKAGRYTDTLPSARSTYFPLSGPRYPLGVVGVRPAQDKPLSIDQDNLLQNFLSQLSSSIEREQLNDITKETIVLAESEKLYRTLFSSISHELRTPIAAIISASEGLTAGVPQELGTEFASEVRTAALRLHQLVENLLDMSRLESGLIQPRLDWCDVQDLIQTVARKMKKETAKHRLVIREAGGLPLLRIDFGLMEQALANLIRNAVSYTPEKSVVEIGASMDGDSCAIEVADNGPGFPPESLPRLFDKFYRVPGSPSGGTGLGLSIARGFVEAHKGTIAVDNRPTGGARFTIRLPVSEQPHVHPLPTDG
jgi:two-component system sensor histidine kinase KdpD